jgi:hypothetical protein
MLRRMQTKALFGAALLAWAALTLDAAAVTLAEAMSAYRNNRVAEAEAMLGEVTADPAASAADRAAALRELGRIDWLVRGETDGAAAALAAVPDGEARCAALLLALRVYREAGAPQTALDEAARGRGECAPAAADSMRIAIARAHLAAARPAAAAAELAAIGTAARRAPDVAAAKFSLALAQADAAAAVEAWRDYFWLDAADAPQALSAYAGRVEAVFAAGLAAGAAEADRIALIEFLIRAGFADDARALAGAMSAAPGWAHARAYFTFRDAVAEATLRANREMAAGGRAEWYRERILAALATLMRDAGLSIEASDDPRVTTYRTMTALAGAYGLFGTVGETSGYPSLHAGHLVQDERLAVAQYGRSGEIRFVVLDNMLANGFESWLWDGWAEAGGWSGGGVIVQVRSAYTHGPLGALRRARPGPDRDRFAAAIERTAADERAALGRDGVAALPAASDRLELQAIDQIAARTSGDDGAFLAAFWRETVNTSITLHEGRHALDQAANAAMAGEELEFRAKLSEIALSGYPRLGLANVAGQAQGDTAHGQANRRVLEGYRRWMRAHRREIAGFDRRAPTLAQLHLLSDDQIIAAAQSLDPWAR